MKIKLIAAALILVHLPASAQEPFDFPAPVDVLSVTSARNGPYMITLDVTGSPVLRCWKDGGLLERACAELVDLHTAGFSGYKFTITSPTTYNLSSLQITAPSASWNDNPEWRAENGCVDNVLVVNQDVRQIHIAANPSPIQATCDASVGGLLGAICRDIQVGDCGSFQGSITGTLIQLDQIVARRNLFLGY